MAPLIRDADFPDADFLGTVFPHAARSDADFRDAIFLDAGSPDVTPVILQNEAELSLTPLSPTPLCLTPALKIDLGK